MHASLNCSYSNASLAHLHESGGYRLKFPLTESPLALIVNTGGGVVGGDEIKFNFEAVNASCLAISSLGAEKIYCANGKNSSITTHLKIDNSSKLHWLPQETLLYNQAKLSRTIDVELATGSELVLCEMLSFGRQAFGEVVNEATLQDKWLIKRDNALIHAEMSHFSGNISEKLKQSAIGNGATTLSTLIIQHKDAPNFLEFLQAFNFEGIEVGATFKSGVLIARILSRSTERNRLSIREILGTLTPEHDLRFW